MTEEQHPQNASSEWGAPQPKPANGWTTKKSIAAVAIAVGITAAGGVAIYAASGTNAGTDAGMGGMAGGPPQDGGGTRMGGNPFGTATHGLFQTGEVTAISDSSVEVKSTDGYTKTYVIDADTVAEGVAQGDTVTVVAEEQDGKAVASTVTEPGQRGRGQQGQTPPTR